MTYRNYVNYIDHRWHELEVPEQTAAIRAKYGDPTQAQVNTWINNGDPRGQAIWDELFHLHAPAFHRILGELYWTQGRADVGAGRKPGGHNYHGLAEDIIVLKPIDEHGNVAGDHPVQLVDAVYAMGGVQPRIEWRIIDPNPERTWAIPLKPDGSTPVPEPPPPPPPPPTPGDPPPIQPPLPPPVEYDALLDLMRELGDVYGIPPGWEGTMRGLAAVVAHWSYGMCLEGRSAASVREDYEARKG